MSNQPGEKDPTTDDYDDDDGGEDRYGPNEEPEDYDEGIIEDYSPEADD